MFIGKKLKLARQRLQLTQQQLADGEIQRSLISQFENDLATPSLQTLCALSERLGLPLSYFVENTKERQHVTNILQQAKKLCTQRRYNDAVEILLSTVPAVGNYDLKWKVFNRASQYLLIQNKQREAVSYLRLAQTFLTEPYDVARVLNGLLQLSQVYTTLLQFHHALEVVNEVQDILDKSNELAPTYTLYATQHTGRLLYTTHQFHRAKVTLHRSLERADALHLYTVAATTHQMLALVYRQLNQFADALQHDNIAVQYFNEEEYSMHRAASFMNIGDIFIKKQQAAQAVHYYRMAYTHLIADASVIPLLCKKLAAAYVQLQQFTSAAQWAKKGIVPGHPLNIELYALLATTYMELEQYERAQHVIKQALHHPPGK